MADKKVVDSDALNNGLTSVANAIRGKTGGTAALSFPEGMVSAIQGITTGGGSGGSTPQRATGSFTTDGAGEAAVSLPWVPDFMFIETGIDNDSEPGYEYRIMAGADFSGGDFVDSASWLFADGGWKSIDFFFTRNGATIYLSVGFGSESGGDNPSAGNTYNYTAIKL